jgi:hypothetical protein
MASGDAPAEPSKLSGLDKIFAETNIIILVLFAICCWGLFAIPLVLGVIGMVTCKDPTAKKNATIVAAISGIFLALAVIGNFAGLFGNIFRF